MYTVMVIDDSPFIVDIFMTMLQRGGLPDCCRVWGAGSP